MEFLNLNLNRKRVKDIGISCQTYLSFNVRRSLQIPGEVVDLSSNRTSLASDLLANQIIEMNIRIPMSTEFISIAIKNTKTTTLRALLRQVRNTETVRKTHKNIDCN
jgi:hypothetical protein